MAKELNLQTLIGDKFKVAFTEAGVKTLMRTDGPRCRIHVKGLRKKHYVEIFRGAWDGLNFDKRRLIVSFQSERTRHNYKVFDDQVNPTDPNFNLDFVDEMVTKVVKFVEHMQKIEEHLAEAHDLFDPPKWAPKGAYDPNRGKKGRKVSWTGV